ncbi:MAG: tetratricopeptide repeat protein [Variibacter sp.]|nr:tetratricopeptide repeat protein [Variibacter sp.]
MAPQTADRYGEALTACEQGRLEDAAVIIREAIAEAPQQTRLHALLGRVLTGLGHGEDALAALDRAIALGPATAGLWGSRGDALATLGRLAQAVQSYDRALALDPDSINDWCNRGAALNDLGRHEEAAASFAEVIRRAKDFAPAHYNHALAQIALKRYRPALDSLDRAIAIEPGFADAHNNRAIALDQLDRREEALAAVERALALDPGLCPALLTRAVILRKLGRAADALDDCARALAKAPDSIDTLTVRADLLVDLDRFEEAMACFDRLIALDPTGAGPKWNKSFVCLGLGRLAEGWALYEHRWAGAHGLVPRPYRQPRWDGTPIDGPLLVWGEQGLGDEILHASMIPDLQTRVRSVILEVEPRLVPLFVRSFPGVRVIALGPALYSEPFAAQIPIAGLGQYFRPDWQAFPERERGYLVADAARSRALRRRLDDGRPLIGLSWVSRAPVGGEHKSARLADFAPLLEMRDLRFIDLQYGDTRQERESIERSLGVRVERLDDVDTTNDLDGLAALMCACDAVVTVSNTTAHLAGALGRPTWVLVPHGQARIWYWFRDRERSPWYPRVRVRRQRTGQPWTMLTAAAAAEVRAMLSAGG